MAGGTKRLPRAVREQQMLDAAVQIFSVNGYHETSMDAIAAEAEISKPMLYLYYGSKEELFGACLNRELNRFVDVVRADIDLTQSPKELLRNTVLSFLHYIDVNRASWMVLYTQATSSQAFAHTVREGRERIIDLVARLLRSGTRHPEPDTDFDMMAVALVGAGEAVATRVSTGDADVQRGRRADDQSVLARAEGHARGKGRRFFFVDSAVMAQLCDLAAPCAQSERSTQPCDSRTTRIRAGSPTRSASRSAGVMAVVHWWYCAPYPAATRTWKARPSSVSRNR